MLRTPRTKKAEAAEPAPAPEPVVQDPIPVEPVVEETVVVIEEPTVVEPIVEESEKLELELPPGEPVSDEVPPLP